MPESEGQAGTPPRPLFLTTHWSVVLAAKDKNSPGCSEALESLCRTYWYPLYAFIRGSGYSPHDAQDLTQGFFEKLLTKDYLRVVEPEKGRFRTFLKMALKRFLVHEWERAKAGKRGGDASILSFDTRMAEQRFQTQAAHALGPDQIYDRQWAVTLLSEAGNRLENEYSAAGKVEELRALRAYLTAERGQIPYAQIALTLRVTEGAARVAVHRLRKRFRELFRELIAETVSEPAEVDEELHHVIAALSGP
ncbi:MAG TPA: sigma-70 family RNA polymerase sigma factor [Verrucomicrobiae bacterium]|nr:sigma-70 family RNA polymerase sigma factor [Verrucomicrobiae bacterium]